MWKEATEMFFWRKNFRKRLGHINFADGSALFCTTQKERKERTSKKAYLQPYILLLCCVDG